MSQANDLLNGLTEDEIAAYATRPESEPHIVIDENRKITIPEELKRLAVQFDHNMETVTFDCPRYWDGIDMSAMQIYINYKLSNGKLGSYHATNVCVDKNDTSMMHFDWTLTGNATEVAGAISFLVCVKKVNDEDDTLDNHWNSELSTSAYISQGLEGIDGNYVQEQYPDIVTQLLTRMDVIEADAEKVNEHATAAKEAAIEATNRADEIARLGESIDEKMNVVGNAVTGSASGEIIRIDDASPLEHTVKARVCGKNIYHAYTTRNMDAYGMVVSMDENSSELIFNGTSTREFIFNIGDNILLTPGTYTVSVFGLNAGASDRVYLCESANEQNAFVNFIRTNEPKTFTLNTEMNVRVKGVIGVNSTYENQTVKIQIEKGNAATKYVPYIDPTTVVLRTRGKNLFDRSNLYQHDLSAASGWATTILTNEMTKKTFYPNTKYTIKFKAVCVEDVPYATFFSADIGFGLFNSATNGLIVMKLQGGSDESKWLSAGKSIECSGTFVTPETLYDVDSYRMVMYTQRALDDNGNAVYNKLNFKELSIELGDTVDEYTEYVGESYEPSTDGIIDIPSMSPTMTLFTDTKGAVIDIDYNKDINKAIGSGGGTGGGSVDLSNYYTKAEIDTKIGDIDSLLDDIIAIQTSLIGGES